MQAEATNIIQTIAADCRDCYRCVRTCPVKAIRISEGQAHVIDELCIQCGTCVRECPQHAKVHRSQLELVREMLAGGRLAAASVAPSFAGCFPGWQAMRIPAALRQLGFAHVAETAQGAAEASRLLGQLPRNEHYIGTACPVVVRYIEKYHPELIPALAPVASPMILHGRMLKARWGQDCAVVFIGPCTAKKQEALRPENRGSVDFVLTFDELQQWLEEAGISLASCPASDFEGGAVPETARRYPLEGGMLLCSGKSDSCEETETLHFSGAAALKELTRTPLDDLGWTLTEGLFCEGGCLNGPCMIGNATQFSRRASVLEHSRAARLSVKAPEPAPEIDTSPCFDTQAAVHQEPVSRDEIRRVYRLTGKSSPAMRLNCGACGYDTCREKAVAVVQGKAEPEMCMPYMRRLAQLRSDQIVERSPNAVVMVDRKLIIYSCNPAFCRLFRCGQEVLGRPIGELLDNEGFEAVAAGHEHWESLRSRNGKRYHEAIYALPANGQMVGTYTLLDAPAPDAAQRKTESNRLADQARALLEEQISFAQKAAQFLGETTARTETLTQQLLSLLPADEEWSENR